MAKQTKGKAKTPREKGGSAEAEAAKAARKREKRIVKLEAELADAREIRSAADVLIRTLQSELAELRGDEPRPAPAGRTRRAPARARTVRRSRVARPGPPPAAS